MNLMRPLTAELEDNYCNITVANYELISLIRFIAQNYISTTKKLVLSSLGCFCRQNHAQPGHRFSAVAP